MHLAAGERLGPYEIVARVGAGGMGEVYRAYDSRLRRDVAIKVLRRDALDSEERRKRFEVEARAASALNHPNILTIHDTGQEGGAPYVVSELLEGQTLRDALARGRLPMRELLDIAVQAADGLAAAHAAGILHRDLKPENLFVLPDGRVKILDFGLAKALVGPGEDDRTRTGSELLTSPGTVVGTIAYMSPEQVEGQPLSFRSDQFSFGTILYEMATGKRPFRGEDQAATLAAIVKEDPEPVATLQPRAPAPFRWVIERCLSKDPARRFASTTDLYQQLRDLRDHLQELTTNETAAIKPAARRQWLRTGLWVAGAAALGFVLAAVSLPPSFQSEPYRYTPFATEAMSETQPAWSPDGQSLAYIGVVEGVGQVFTRALAAPVPAQLTKSAEDCSDPFWSPDGTRIYFRTGTTLRSVGAAGGVTEMVLPQIAPRSLSATVAPDGKSFAYFRPEGGAVSLVVQPSGGAAQVYKTPPFPEKFRFGDSVRFAPNGRKLIVALVPSIGPNVREELWVVPYPNGTPRRVPWQLNAPAAGRITYVGWAGDNRYCLLSEELSFGARSHLRLVDTETGKIWLLTSGTSEESHPAASPDGRKIAFTSGSFNYDLTQIGLDGTNPSPLLATARQEYWAEWSPSGTQYVYVSDAAGNAGVWLRSVAEHWARPVLTAGDGEFLGRAQPRLSPDGNRLAYVLMGGRHAVQVVNVAGGHAVPLEQESDDQHGPVWSPDGNWIAYTRFIGGKWEIAKVSSGGGGKPVRIGAGGIPESILAWSPNGQWIDYLEPDAVFQVSAAGGEPRRIHGPAAAIALSKDGNTLYAARRGKDRGWEIAALSVPEGVERKVIRLSLPAESDIRHMSLHPDGRSFTVSVGMLSRDIWILEGFEPPAGPLQGLWPRWARY